MSLADSPVQDDLVVVAATPNGSRGAAESDSTSTRPRPIATTASAATPAHARRTLGFDTKVQRIPAFHPGATPARRRRLNGGTEGRPGPSRVPLP